MPKTKKHSYKFDANKRLQWLNTYKKTGSFTSSCQVVKIDRSTVYLILKSDHEFAKEKQDLDNLIDDTVENRLHTLTKKSPVACFFWLCNRRGKTWHNIQKMEHSGSVGVTLVIDKNDAKL